MVDMVVSGEGGGRGRLTDNRRDSKFTAIPLNHVTPSYIPMLLTQVSGIQSTLVSQSQPYSSSLPSEVPTSLGIKFVSVF